MSKTKNFDDDFFKKAQNEYIPALDGPEAQKRKELEEEIEADNSNVQADRFKKKIEQALRERYIKLFSPNGKMINLNNFNKRTSDLAKRRNQLLRLVCAFAIEELAKSGRKRADFASFKAATIMLAGYVNIDNTIVGIRQNDYLNTDQLKELLATEDFNMSKSTAELYIRCAKKAKVLKKLGKGKDCRYMLNPGIHLNSYYTRISTEIFFEFPETSRLYFNIEQYSDIKNMIQNEAIFTPEEKKRLAEGIEYERE